MSPSPVRVGVVGLGVGALAHVPVLRIEGFDVVALAASSAAKASETAERLGVRSAFGDYRDLLAAPDIDAVTVATPSAMHHEVTLAALAAGKHVLVEKPITITLKDAAEVRDVARASGLTAMIAHAYRFSPVRLWIGELLDSGYVGTVRTVSVTYASAFPSGDLDDPALEKVDARRMHWRMDASRGGGFLDGAGSTFFDSLRVWFGEVTGVTGRTMMFNRKRMQPDGRVATDADSDEGFVAYCTFANGAVGTVHVNAAAPGGPGGRIDIFGSEGNLQILQPFLLPGPDTTVSGARLADGGGVEPLPVPDRLQIPADERDPLPFFTAYRPLVRAFAHGIATGTSPAPNFDDAYKDQEITEAILESTKTGEFVTLSS